MESTRTLPSACVFETRTVAGDGVLGFDVFALLDWDGVAAVALLLLPPPQAATDNAASGTASATARRLMGLRRLIATLREVVGS